MLGVSTRQSNNSNINRICVPFHRCGFYFTIPDIILIISLYINRYYFNNINTYNIQTILIISHSTKCKNKIQAKHKIPLDISRLICYTICTK